MKNRPIYATALLVVSLALSACGGDGPPDGGPPSGVPSSSENTAVDLARASSTAATIPVARWYKQDQVQRGAAVYAANCAACHGEAAQGAYAWRKRDPTGKLPPPPLNGTGHAWHHPIRALGYQIKFGAPGGNGSMPGFAETLSDEEVLDTLAWFQSKWPDEVYKDWFDIEMKASASSN
jgi:mono/diheme cytochrome c family protein